MSDEQQQPTVDEPVQRDPEENGDGAAVLASDAPEAAKPSDIDPIMEALAQAAGTTLALSPKADSEDGDSSEHLGLHVKEGDDMTRVTTPAAFSDRSGNTNTTDLSTPAAHGERFMGKKERRNSSAFKMFMYDYLALNTNKVIQERMAKNGDTKVSFADFAIKVNRRNKMQKRVLLITDQGIYNMDPVGYKIKRRIEIAKLAYISLSTLPDNFFCMHVAGEYDYLMVSGRKVEIVTVLMFNYNQITGKTLEVRFCDSFEYKIGTGSSRQIHFSRVDGGVSTQIFDKKA